MKKLFALVFIAFLLLACDIKKSSISGTVVSKSTGTGVSNALVNFIECKTNGENCAEVVIGQIYTAQDGSFVINEKMGSKSKTKWITVTKDGKKVGQKDNVGLNDKNMVIEIP